VEKLARRFLRLKDLKIKNLKIFVCYPRILSVSLIGGFITILIIASLLGTVLGESIMAVTPVGEFPQALEYNPSNN
jgi:hypothetical protein